MVKWKNRKRRRNRRNRRIKVWLEEIKTRKKSRRNGMIKDGY